MKHDKAENAANNTSIEYYQNNTNNYNTSNRSFVKNKRFVSLPPIWLQDKSQQASRIEGFTSNLNYGRLARISISIE